MSSLHNLVECLCLIKFTCQFIIRWAPKTHFAVETMVGLRGDGMASLELAFIPEGQGDLVVVPRASRRRRGVGSAG